MNESLRDMLDMKEFVQKKAWLVKYPLIYKTRYLGIAIPRTPAV